MAESLSIDPFNDADIKTKSIEQTLLPLIKQVRISFGYCRIIYLLRRVPTILSLSTSPVHTVHLIIYANAAHSQNLSYLFCSLKTKLFTRLSFRDFLSDHCLRGTSHSINRSKISGSEENIFAIRTWSLSIFRFWETMLVVPEPTLIIITLIN